MAGLSALRVLASPGAALSVRALLRLAGDVLLALVLPAALLALWEWLARSGRINDIFFPPPTRIASTSWEMLRGGDLLEQTWVTTRRIVIGFLLGAVPAIALGLAMGLWRPARTAFLPTITALYPIPRIAILPMVILIFGLTERSKIFMSAFSVFFLVAINTVAGVRAVDRVLFDVARSFRAGRWQTYVSVALPGALPFIMAGAKLGIGFVFIITVGTEFLIPGDGLGSLIWRSYQILDLETMYVALATTVILGWLLILAVDVVERLVVRWRPEG